ncbi:MAG: TIGR04282 family arsenosugar biosynthesis glycosyltransferase [Nitrospirae bacterium]|nr:TIGR04282 family arsenosugar biosynthesis glycosyltransferase [Nitrospirota bacterium]
MNPSLDILPRKAVVLYAKLPVVGTVKTRLFSILTPEQSQKLYEAFLFDTLDMITRLTGVTPFIACTPSREEPYFRELAGRYAVSLLDQRGEDLGQRMEGTLNDLLGSGWDQVVILGTDSPTLPVPFLEEAFDVLSEQGPNHVVLGPSCDGGYYLVGAAGRTPSIFSKIPWSTAEVLSRTMERLHDGKVSYTLLPFWYDVDTPEDLRFLRTHLRYLEDTQTAAHTRQVLKKLSKI